MPQEKIKRKLSESDVSGSENNDQSDDEYLPQSTGKSFKPVVKKPKRVAVKKSKKFLSDASDSDDEPLGKSLQKKSPAEKSSQKNSLPDDGKFMSQTTGRSPKRSVKTNKRIKKSKAILTDTTISDDEPYVKSDLKKSLQNNSSSEDDFKLSAMVNRSSKKSDPEEQNDSMLYGSTETLKQPNSGKKNERSNALSDEDEACANLVEPKVEEISENEQVQSSSSEDEPLIAQSKTNASNLSPNRSSISTDEDNSDEEDVKKPMKRLEKDRTEKMSTCTISSDDEPLSSSSKQSTTRENNDQTLKERSDRSSDEDEPIRKIKASKSKGNSKKVSELSNSSEDESVASKSKISSNWKTRKNRKHIQSRKNRYDESSDEEESTSKVSKTSRSKKASVTSDDSSDEDFTIKKDMKKTSKKLQNTSKKKSKPTEKGHDTSSDEEIPLTKITKTNGKSKRVSMPSSGSEDELLSIRKEMSVEEPKVNGKDESRHTENGHGASSDEDEPLTKIAKWNGKSKKASISSDDASDEEFTNKNDKEKTSKKSQSSQELPKKKSKRAEKDQGALSDEEVPLTKIAKTNGNSKRVSVPSSDSEDELLSIQSELSFEQPKTNGKDESIHTENSHDTSDEDEPATKISKTNKKSKMASISSDDASDEDFTIKNKKKKTSNESQSNQKAQEKKLKPMEENNDALSDEEVPLTKFTKANGKSKRAVVSSSDDEDFAVQKNKKKTAKKSPSHKIPPEKKSSQKSGSASSSDESEPLSKVVQKSKAKASTKKNSSNNRIEHLKKYLRVAGIRVKSYDALFKDCKSIKSKVEKLLDTLQDKGLKGNPTIEKCKKLKKEIERKQEVAELDTANIIKTEGRPKRGGSTLTFKHIPNSPDKKKFLRLKDIIDSEESD